MISKVLAVLFSCGVLAGFVFAHQAPLDAADTLPDRLDDGAFWQITSDFSEADGYFDSDNFVSNEQAFQSAGRRLRR